ncbi:MAG TPA: hypothetical protein DCX14_00535 [Flavobacteriales bacterium]|jgi:hypothetical protein|nr:DUF2807 domain-containing protein [Flavobacteriales bacterium]MDB9701448.1 DUF2807 domain-containing protein [Salibacteraceae bacterium]HAW18644.1 hypothetical protein [Flavobacteriales bacterium]
MEGPREKRDISIDPASKIELNLVADLGVKVDTSQETQLEVIAQSGVFEKLNFSRIGEEMLYELDGCIRENEPILMSAIMPQLEQVTINSAGKVFSEAIVVNDYLRFTNKGLGDIDFVIKSDSIIGEVKSSGDLILSGSCRAFSFLSTSSGDLRAYNLVCDSLTLNLFGTSVCEVFTNGPLIINFFSPGVVNYRGVPSSIQITGDGQVNNTNE